MEPQTIHIPANFTDAGKIFGVFEIRNCIEALVLVIPAVFAFFKLLPLGIQTKIILSSLIIVPLAGFALIGIQDHSLVTFLKIYLQWRRHRKILTYRGVEQL